MQYTIPEINNGIAKVQFSDGTWTFVELASDMTEADLDDIVQAHVGRAGDEPSCRISISRLAAARARLNSAVVVAI